MNRKTVIILLFLISLGSLTATALMPSMSEKQKAEQAVSEVTTTLLAPQLKHTRAAEEILIKLQRRHYEKRAFDDSLSSLLLDNYLSNLDPNKVYFTQEDINRFEQYRFSLDDNVRRGNLNPSFDIFNNYRSTAINHLESLIAELPERVTKLDFDIKENIQVDNESLEWPNNHKERKNRLRKNLKNSVLSLRLAEKNDEEIIETLSKRYKNQLQRLNQINNEDVFQIFMNSLISLYDPHSGYMSPRTSENFSINMSLSLEGIGAVLKSDGEYTVVERLVTGGPAELQGDLQPKDKIIGVGQGKDAKVEDVVGWRLDEVVQLIRGKKGSTVRLEILGDTSKANGKSKYIQIVRNKVKLEDQAAQKEVLEVMYDDQLRKIGVIQIPAFYHDYESQMKGDKNYRSTTRDVLNLLTELDKTGAEGVIIDLRGNGGGYLEEAKTLTGLFVDRGPVVQIRYANGRVTPQSNYPSRNHYKKPMIVLIDRLSASASEIFAGAIQDYNRGLVVGSKSFGKGTVQNVSPLSHGVLKLTEAKYYRVSGDSTQHRGVVPDIMLPSVYDAKEIGEDALDYALPWDQISPMRHRSFGNYNSIEGQLFSLHQERVKDDPDYKHLMGLISLNKKYNQIEALPLNISARQTMIDEDKSARKALDNELRVAKGLDPLEEEAIEEVSKENESTTEVKATDTSSIITSLEEEEDEDPRTDFLLNETAYILLDAVKLKTANLQMAKQQ